jgi:hypothetical protein
MFFVIIISIAILFMVIIYTNIKIEDRKLKKKLGTVEIIQLGQLYAVRVFGYRAHNNCSPVRLMPSNLYETPDWYFVDINGYMAYTPVDGTLIKSAQFENMIDANKAASKARYFADKMKVPGSAGTPDLTIKVPQIDAPCDALVVQRNGTYL